MTIDVTVVVLVVVVLAVMISVGPAVLLLRDKRLFVAERGLEHRVAELETEITTLRAALRLYQEQVQALTLDLERARQTIAELKRVAAIYEQFSTIEDAVASAKPLGTTKRSAQKIALEQKAEEIENMQTQLAEYKSQLAILETQIAAAGGDTQAPARDVAHRARLQNIIANLERQLDELNA